MTPPTAGPLCPNGHPSEESDYCSVCGAPMPGAAAQPSATQPAQTCPSCGTPRADASARYCEVCRYDYLAQTQGPPPVVAETAAPAPEPARPVSSAAADSRAEWEVTIAVDPSLDTEPDADAPPPVDVGDRIFPIDLPEMLVGRRDDAHHIRPEIPVIDPGVSRRHAHLLRLPEGGVAIVDLASANGTAVNGVGLVAGQRHELADGDVATVGRWTRITVRRRGQVSR
jgi:hypothetical protein